MDPSHPFKPGAPDPILSDETFDEMCQGYQVGIPDETMNQPIGVTTHVAQEWVERPTTIDPTLLQRTDHTPPEVVGLNSPSVETFVGLASFQIELPQEET
ncbi:hypothetical protein V8C35DRAFT_133654 [Trichoderma chlorosporum]